ncbi:MULTISPECIES: hypothetical protein [unclassified Bradyrhizobium]|uniref:hypothetical protein n=1 Tax=unclassified Bradyrhizobium TaxID=2631580 RepID=UPI00040D1FAD|nr:MULTISPECIES: hypothetical protein [unclassified Bradyrhizobium]MCP3462549.1 hypothetical protein [Bradyrhizobium sp. CCGUVB23]
MKPVPMTAIAVAMLCGASTLAQARPPTVTPSPGYDRRLQESRSAPSGTTTVAPTNPPATTQKRTRKKHTN